MNKKFIFIDIDGTLFDHESNCIPQSSLEALHQAKENGHALFICTGRPLPDVEEEYYRLPIDGLILSCGAHIMIDNKTIYHTQFPQKELKNLINYMIDHKIGFSLEGLKRNYLNHTAYDFFQSFFIENSNENSELARALLKQRDMYPFSEIKEEDYQQILKIAIFSDHDEIKDCRNMIEHLPNTLHGFLNERREEDLITGEISIKGINKATGIDCVLNYFNHDLKDTIAIGDSLNDLEMIEHAEIGICMGNGSPKLKEIADHITDNVNNHGLAKALKHFEII